MKAVAAICAALCACPACERNAKHESIPKPAPSAAKPGAAAPQSLEPCRLLSADEASVVLGGSAVAEPSNAVTHASSCVWAARDPLRGLTVMTSTPAQLRADQELQRIGVDTVEKRYAQLVQTLMVGGKGVPVSGLGDDAVWIDDSQQMWIMKRGRALITVSFHAEQRIAGAFEKSRSVSEKLLARL